VAFFVDSAEPQVVPQVAEHLGTVPSRRSAFGVLGQKPHDLISTLRRHSDSLVGSLQQLRFVFEAERIEGDDFALAPRVVNQGQQTGLDRLDSNDSEVLPPTWENEDLVGPQQGRDLVLWRIRNDRDIPKSQPSGCGT
jgi:hypothetical protein